MEPKKDPNVDVEKRRPLFLTASFLVALGVVLAGLEWKNITVEKKSTQKLELNTMEEQMVQPTQPKKPPKKQPKKTEKVEVVEEEEDIENELTMSDMEIDEDSEFNFEGGEEQAKEDKVFMVVEDDPTFPGGQGKMMKYIQEHLEYPQMAREMDVQGTVHVSFVVQKDGSITDVKVLKGIGSGCDKEAKRVVRNMPKWKPGKQRGRAVKVNVRIPIRFRLN